MEIHDTFSIEFCAKKAATKTKILPEAQKLDFQSLSIRNWIKKAATKTKILPEAWNINFSILFQFKFE